MTAYSMEAQNSNKAKYLKTFSGTQIISRFLKYFSSDKQKLVRKLIQ